MSNYFTESDISKSNLEKNLSDKSIFEKINIYLELLKDKTIIL